MKFRDALGWIDKEGKCGKCGKVQSYMNENCSRCGAAFSNSESFAVNSALTIFLFVIFYPLLNLPAFLPSVIITRLLATNVFPMFVDGFFMIICVILSLLFFSVVVWKVFKYILYMLKSLEGISKTISLCIFWAYIIGCYGFVSYQLGSEFFKDSFWGIAAFTIFGTLVGGGYSGRKLGLIDEDGNEI